MLRKLALLMVLLTGLAFGGEIKRPTTYSGDTSYATNPAYAYDSNDTSTYATIVGDNGGTTAGSRSLTFSGWQSPSGSYSRLVIHIIGACYAYGDSGSQWCSAAILLDNGTTWINAYSSPSNAFQSGTRTDWSFDLPPGTNISNIQVQVTADGWFTQGTQCDYYVDPQCVPTTDTSGYAEADIYGMYTDGTLGATPSPIYARGSNTIAQSDSTTPYATTPCGAFGSYTLFYAGSSVASAIDADPNTGTNYVYATSTSGSGNQGKQWCANGYARTFTKSGTYNAEVVVARLSCTKGGYAGYCYAYYSLNGGSSWSYMGGFSASASAADVKVYLPANTDYSNLIVAFTTIGYTQWGSPYASGYAYTYAYDARVEAYPSNMPPSIGMDYPVSGGTTHITQYQTGVKFYGWATDTEDLGSTTVQYQIDGGTWTNVTGREYRSDITTAYNAGWYYTFNVGTSLTVATHTISARVCDSQSVCTTVGPYNFVVDAEPVPAAPTSPSANPAANGLSVALSWSNPSPAYYFATNRVLACDRTSNGTCTPSQVWSGSPTTSYTYTTTACRTYAFQIATANNGGTTSSTAVFTANTPCAPAATTNPTISNLYSSKAIVTFTGVSGATGYNGYWCLNSSCSWNGVGSVTSPVTFTGLSPNTAYRFTVQPYNAVGETSVSSVSGTTMQLPGTPTLTSVVPSADGTTMTLNWNNTAGGQIRTTYSRCQGSGCSTFSPTGSVSPSLTTTTDTGLTPGTTYRYYLYTANDNDSPVSYSSNSNQMEATMPNYPAAPTSLVATPATNGTSVTLTWTDNATNETGFELWYCTGNACSPTTLWATPGVVSGSSGSTTQTTTACTTYNARINSTNAVGDSSFSNQVQFSTPCVPPTATATISGVGSGQATISWSAISWPTGAGTNAYYVYRSNVTASGGGDSGWVGGAIGTSTYTYTDTGLQPNTTYKWTVKPHNDVGYAADNYSSNYTTLALPLALSTYNSVANADGVSSTLTWTNPGGTATHVGISRCAGSGCSSYSWVADVPIANQTYTNTGLTSGTLYRYRMYTFDNNDTPVSYSANVQPADIVTPLAPVSVESVTGTSAADALSVSVGWNPSANLLTYSNGFLTGANWSGYCGATTNVTANTTDVTAPDSTNTATKYVIPATFTCGSVPSWGPIYALPVGNFQTVGKIYTVSIWARTSTGTATAVLGTDDYHNTTITITTTWQRFSYTANISATHGELPRGFQMYSQTANAIIYVWGAQTEEGSVMTTYHPTTVAAITEPSLFKVERCTGNTTSCDNTLGTWTLLGSPTTSPYTNSPTSACTTYRYRVAASNSVGDATKAYSGDVATYCVPSAPTTFGSSVATNGQSATITWVDTASNETGYHVYNCVGNNCSNWGAPSVLGAGAQTWTGTVSVCTTYTFMIAAYNAVGDSTGLTGVITTPCPPSAPTTLAITSSSSQASLTWTVTSGGTEDNIIVQRCQGSGCNNFADLITLGKGTAAYNDTTVNNLYYYNYRVYAKNGVGNSSYSNTGTYTVSAVPAAPTGLTLTVLGQTAIKVDWAVPAGSPTSYVVERCQGASCSTFSSVGTPSTNTFTDSTAYPFVSYTYRVYGVNAVGNGLYSSNTTAVTPRKAKHFIYPH